MDTIGNVNQCDILDENEMTQMSRNKLCILWFKFYDDDSDEILYILTVFIWILRIFFSSSDIIDMLQ